MHRSFLLLAFVQLCSALLLGQAKPVNAGSPPKYLQIVLEEVRGGSMMAHKHRAAHGATPKASGITVHYLRASSIAGPNGALWFLMYKSLRDLEKQMQEEAANPTRDSGPINGYSKMLARRRDDLSYRPDFNLGEYKFFAVHTFYSKLAHARDAMEVFKILNDAREKSGSEIHIVVYEVMSGAAEGTFFSIVPRKSLAEMEQGDQRMQQAVGEDGWRRIRDLADAGGFMLENTLFAFEPTYSNVPEEMAAANPTFWNTRLGGSKPIKSPSSPKPRAQNP